ncbi:MAG: hypothetical protein WCJ33_00450 [Pseudomonadota bacterium]
MPILIEKVVKFAKCGAVFLFCLILPSISFAEKGEINDKVTYGTYYPPSFKYSSSTGDYYQEHEMVFDVFSQPQIGTHNDKQKIGIIGINIDHGQININYSKELKEYLLVFDIMIRDPIVEQEYVQAFSNKKRKAIPDWVQIGLCKRSQSKNDEKMDFIYYDPTDKKFCNGNLLYGWINKKNGEVISWDELYESLKSKKFMPSIKNRQQRNHNREATSGIKLNDFYLSVKNKKYSELSNDLKEILDYFIKTVPEEGEGSGDSHSLVDRNVYESSNKGLKIGVITQGRSFTVIKKLKNKLLVVRIPTEENINEKILAGWIDMYDDKGEYVIMYHE